MWLTDALRVLLGHQLGPFKFEKDVGYLPDMDVPNLGLYIHVPFCESLCPFCPYYKTTYDREKAEAYRRALSSEIVTAAERTAPADGKRRAVTSLYVGGGSPALMIDELREIRRIIDERFDIRGHAGIELHPRDLVAVSSKRIADAGFDMVSVGVQSFQAKLLAAIGRDTVDAARVFRFLKEASFEAVDVDLIFGIPGQCPDDIRADFLTAVDHGATQISTYPFIDFSYAKNAKAPLNENQKKRMLSALLETADAAGFSRTSVWTFGRKDAPRYSSITRDNFMGFGPSATTLGRDAFKINTFSVEEYCAAANEGIVPTALRMSFSPRSRRLYWLFWNCYNGDLSKSEYSAFFSTSLERDFGFWLEASVSLGLLRRTPEGWALTERGSYRFHRIEQVYTRQYIDKTWRTALKSPWPDEIRLY